MFTVNCLKREIFIFIKPKHNLSPTLMNNFHIQVLRNLSQKPIFFSLQGCLLPQL